MTIGLDYASIDGNLTPNWKALYSLGFRFVLIRANWGAWSDPTPLRDAELAKSAGFTVGYYVGPKIQKSESPAKQIAAFCNACKIEKFKDFAPVLDIEMPSVKVTGMSIPQIHDFIMDLEYEVRKVYGVRSIIYSSARVLDGTDTDSLSGYPFPDIAPNNFLWLARYGVTAKNNPIISNINVPWPPVPKQWGDSSNSWIHQYQGDAVIPTFTDEHPASTDEDKLWQHSNIHQFDLNRFRTTKLGDTGDRIKNIQRLFVNSGICHSSYKIDGVFGDDFNQNLKSFQSKYNLISDGIIGPKTFAALTWLNKS